MDHEKFWNLKGESTMKLFAGYDGGGTKTACVLTDETGRLLGTGIGGPSNYLYCGKELAAESVRTATEQAFKEAGLEPRKLDAAYMASAAILLANGDAHVPFFSTCIDADLVLCDSDIYPIWYGSVREKPAVVQIAGTGALTYVCSTEGFTRVSGWGPLLGDEGSGYDVALRALKKVCRMYDGREPMDQELVDTIFAHYEAESPFGILRAFRQGDSRSIVASCGKIIFDLYAKGNATAKALLEETADEIALAVTTAAKISNQPTPLPAVFSGSLVQPGRALYPMLEERLLKDGSPISYMCGLDAHPAAAAAALALHARGLDEAGDALLENAKGVML